MPSVPAGEDQSSTPHFRTAVESSVESGTQSPSVASETSSTGTKTASSSETPNSTPESNDREARKPAIELADFIYRDNPRINSLYSQLFNGLLLNTETTEAAKDAAERGIGLAAVVTGAMKKTVESNRSVKETRHPHDAIAGDLIASLGALGRVSDDFERALPGQLVRAHGTLFLFDSTLLQMAASIIPSFAAQQGGEQAAVMMAAVINAMPAPTGFVLRTNSGDIVGTLDPAGLHEPIAASYFKHGKDGIAGVGLIGLREGRGSGASERPFCAPLLDGMQGFADALHDMLFPADGIRVAPLALFRSVC